MSLRIQKFLSQAGYCSRRKAETLINEQRISVNGTLAHLGQVIGENDVVVVDQTRIKSIPKQRIVLLLNKPRGVECTVPNYSHQQTVYDFIPKAFSKEHFFYCGRLDKESQGMLILTNDGEFVNQLSHPRSNISKIYHVTLAHSLTPGSIEKMLQGISDNSETLIAEKIYELPSRNQRPLLEIHLKQGRKREIRRMIQACGNFVHRLKRVQIGQLKLKNLNVGAVKQLSDKEIDLLFA